jgi:TolA-binding protein
MEMVFQDFVDASFLDVMLLKWAIAAQKMGDTELAKEKLNQLIAEYPNSKVIGTAIRFKEGLE